MNRIALLYGTTCVAVGAISFAYYGIDKRSAKLGRPRVPERTLHKLDLAGGWIGGLLGRRCFRHKTCDRRFLLVARTIAILHCLIIVAFAFAATKLRILDSVR